MSENHRFCFLSLGHTLPARIDSFYISKYLMFQITNTMRTIKSGCEPSLMRPRTVGWAYLIPSFLFSNQLDQLLRQLLFMLSISMKHNSWSLFTVNKHAPQTPHTSLEMFTLFYVPNLVSIMSVKALKAQTLQNHLSQYECSTGPTDGEQ